MIDPNFIELLNRHKLRYPSSTESLDRTPYHNLLIKGAKLSRHLSTIEGGAKAADLILDRAQDLIPAAIYAKELGFQGIEVDFRNLHLHLDQRDVLWHVVCIGKDEYTLEEYLTIVDPSDKI